jgi:aminoglycoside phosphotransferase (APT) family kinase protein
MPDELYSNPAMPIDPSSPDEVSAALLVLLATRLSRPDLRFTRPPERLGRGLDTYIYAFRLAGNEVGPEWTSPLVLRLYQAADRSSEAAGEAAILQFVRDCGYPAPTVLAVEECAGTFGLPLIVMERVPGIPMLDQMMRKPLDAVRLLALMADLHVALHRLPTAACPLPYDQPMIERMLTDFRNRVDRLDLRELHPGLRLLEERRTVVLAEDRSLCHNDFHPLNILVDGDHGVVVDWSGAAIGDRHCDVARTLGVFSFAWIAARSSFERQLLRCLRGLLRWRYLSCYRRGLSIDRQRLSYWEAVHAFQALVQLAEVRNGARPDVARRLPPNLASEVSHHFWLQARRI